MNLSEKVGTRIKKFRLEKELTQDELAYRSNLQQSQIYRLENGLRRFNSSHLEKISQALDIPVRKFFEEEDKISRELEEQKLLDKIYRLRPDKRKEVIDFLLNIDEDIDIKILEKALEIIRIAGKK